MAEKNGFEDQTQWLSPGTGAGGGASVVQPGAGNGTEGIDKMWSYLSNGLDTIQARLKDNRDYQLTRAKEEANIRSIDNTIDYNNRSADRADSEEIRKQNEYDAKMKEYEEKKQAERELHETINSGEDQAYWNDGPPKPPVEPTDKTNPSAMADYSQKNAEYTQNKMKYQKYMSNLYKVDPQAYATLNAQNRVSAAEEKDVFTVSKVNEVIKDDVVLYNDAIAKGDYKKASEIKGRMMTNVNGLVRTSNGQVNPKTAIKVITDMEGQINGVVNAKASTTIQKEATIEAENRANSEWTRREGISSAHKVEVKATPQGGTNTSTGTSGVVMKDAKGKVVTDPAFASTYIDPKTGKETVMSDTTRRSLNKAYKKNKRANTTTEGGAQ